MEDYNPRFLANWMAETYQITMADASLSARKIALDQKRESIRHQIPSQAANFFVDSSKMLVESYRLILLPAWMSYYNLEDTKYHLVINGQTGQVHAELPQQGLKGWFKGLFARN
jgi:hypothetical protein